MHLKSFAKINLTLDILGKREDGYHDIDTILQQINLCDDIDLEEDSTITLTCSKKGLENEDNLAYKAAVLLKEKYAKDKGVKIHIEKKIPIGAGLSGGSSNAATVLLGLNDLWNLNLSEDQLLKEAEKLGMDVCFHILGGTCRGQGRGDKLTKLPTLKNYFVIVLFPEVPINTKNAYSLLDLSKCGKTKSTEKFLESNDLKYLHNDFEPTIFEELFMLEDMKADLGSNALLSGSGSSIYGLFDNQEKAQEIYDNLKKKYSTLFLTTTR